MADGRIPTIREGYERFLAEYASRTGFTGTLKRASLVRAMAWVVSTMAYSVNRYSAVKYYDIFIETCRLRALIRHGERIGVFQKEGTYTILEARFENVFPSTIFAGTSFVVESGATFYTVEDHQVINGVVQIVATADEPGDLGYAEVGEVIKPSSPGSLPDGVVISIQTEGVEAETIDEYRQRVATAHRLRGVGGSFANYYFWATEVPGISDVFPYVIQLGITTLYVAKSGSGMDRIPGPALRSTVSDYVDKSPTSSIYDRRPTQSKVSVVDVIPTLYDVTITGLEFSANTADAHQSIKSALLSYFDDRKPEIPAYGYTSFDATISEAEASALATSALRNGSYLGNFSDLSISVGGAAVDGFDILEVGHIAVLNTLTINGVVVP
jgi:uncharacterized phage protein gp47/JayE